MQLESEASFKERFRTLTGVWYWLAVLISVIAIVVAINQLFHLQLFGIMLLDTSYYYLLLGIFLCAVFLIFPINRRARGTNGLLFWIDIFLLILTFGICVTLTIRGYDIIYKGWMIISPTPFLVLGILLWLLVLEGLRRSAGKVLFTIVFLVSLFPLVAEYMPAFLQGIGFTFIGTINYHSFSIESMLGIPMQVFSNLLVGFMIFGVALVALGGGDFFMNLALSLLGHTRGGPAKVAVVASAFFGSMSGSAISNVITTGSITIPTMKRTGYPPYFSAAVEACSSTGGVLMPPIMGATAFVMAMFLNTTYLTVVVAAIIPSLLYYLGLLIQVDGHAARNNLAGLPRAELPSLIRTLKEGWFYLFALVLLVVFLFLRMEAQAPFYATAFLLICANFRKETRLNLERIKKFLYQNTRLLAELVTLFAAIGMIIGSLSMTGVAHCISREIVYLAGESLPLLLLLGAFASFLLGMGMTITACYIFLAITLAPALVAVGLNPMAVHLFVMYCGMMSYITPPVCVAVYPAATIAGSKVMQTGFTAMRLGAVKYLVPFLFVLSPALILQGPFLEAVPVIISAFIGIILIGSGLEGYLVGLGELGFNRRTSRLKSVLLRLGIFASGLLLAIPETQTDFIGLGLGACIIIPMLIIRHRGKIE